MSDEAGVWERPLGLMGIWGDIIYEWLDDVLPMDAVEVVNDEVCFSIHSLLHHTAASTHYLVLCACNISVVFLGSFTSLLHQYHHLESKEYLILKVERT
jgi:hypothetical protein